jgi:hypothetical protein
MGINSTGTAYDFGQLGSAYTSKAVEIIPPKDHVIVAITFLDAAGTTPTVLTPERLDEAGPGYIGITGTTAADVEDHEATITSNINFAGACGSAVGNGTHTAYTNITLTNPPSDTSLIRKGQYVLTVDPAATENGSTAMGYDVANGTPFPVYNGPHKTGARVASWDGVDKVQLDTTIATSGEALIFIDEHHGAGGITAAGQAYPAGLTIYGRWTAFKTENAKGAICYFGK